MRAGERIPPWHPPDVWSARIRGLGTSIYPPDERPQQLTVTLHRTNTFGGEAEQERKEHVETAATAFIERLQDHLVEVFTWRHAAACSTPQASYSKKAYLPRLVIYARPCDFGGLSDTDYPVGTWIVDVPEGCPETRFRRREAAMAQEPDDSGPRTPTYA